MIRASLEHGVGRLFLARPDKKNAFNGDMLQTIAQTVTAWGDDPACRVIVLGSDGETFCAGADLGWMAAQAAGGDQANRENARMLGGVFHQIAKCKKPVVGRIQGAARGGGVGLASAVDIAVGSHNASFALTEVRLGLLPGVISPFVVERLGPSHARALFMTGETVDADEAHRLGLLHKLVAPDQLDAAVEQVVQLLVQGGPEALLACKRLVDAVAFRQPEDVFDHTVQAIAERRASAEAMEGMMAFLEKRKANWIP